MVVFCFAGDAVELLQYSFLSFWDLCPPGTHPTALHMMPSVSPTISCRILLSSLVMTRFVSAIRLQMTWYQVKLRSESFLRAQWSMRKVKPLTFAVNVGARQLVRAPWTCLVLQPAAVCE